MSKKSDAEDAAIQANWDALKGMDLNDILKRINEVQDEIDERKEWLEALIARRNRLAPPAKRTQDFVL